MCVFVFVCVSRSTKMSIWKNTRDSNENYWLAFDKYRNDGKRYPYLCLCSKLMMTEQWWPHFLRTLELRHSNRPHTVNAPVHLNTLIALMAYDHYLVYRNGHAQFESWTRFLGGFFGLFPISDSKGKGKKINSTLS